MRKCKAMIRGVSPYSSSRQTDYDIPHLDREGHDDYDKRVWRMKSTVNDAGHVCIPAMAWKQAIDTSAFKLGLKVPNRRGSTYKSFFASGFFTETDTPISSTPGKLLTRDDAKPVTISANSDGVRGSGKRVPRCFPVWDQWVAEPVFIITDDILTPDIFEQHLRAAGVIVGVGRFRPEKGGVNGRFSVVSVDWEDYVI
jgi:hypothetical protein